MADLSGQTIASSYEQLLSLPDGGGNANTLVAVTDGDGGTTFGIKLATNKVEIIPGSNDTNAFEVSQADGTAVLTVDSTNARVGIGNSSPSYNLDVVENAETNVVRFFNDGGDQNRDVMILQGGADSGPGNTRFITFNDGNGDAFGFIQGPADSATSGISFNTTADTSLLTLKGSSVGIGTVSPSATRLHVSAPDALNSTEYLVTMQNLETTDGHCMGLFINAGQGSSDDALRVQTRPGVEALRVKGNGAVSMAGSLTTSGTVTTAGLTSSNTIFSSMSGTGPLANTAFRTLDGNSNEGLRIEHGGGDGRILLYSAGSHRGSITANEHTAGANGLTVGTTANEDLNFVTNGTSNIRARVFKDGNVGIGNHSSGNAITTSANQLKVYDDSAGSYAQLIQQAQGDGLCLDLFASASDDHADDAILKARTDANTLLELFNDGDLNLGPGGFYTNTVDNTKGFIFTDGSTTSSFPNVQNSGGKGMVQGRLEITASGGAQNVAKSHWGGISLIGFSASGLQGIDIVGWGYAPTTPVVLATGNWVGSLSRSYSTVNYHLQMNVGSTVNVFSILIGI